jgi:SAM-dependent methyltransferase
MSTPGGLFRKFIADPLGFLRRAWAKMVTGPLRYRQGEGYDGERFWRDRFARLDGSLTAAGDEGLDASENQAAYAAAGRQVAAAILRARIALEGSRVLEVGPGTGFYADLIAQAGGRDYTALDITDVLFPALRKRHPMARFEVQDITEQPINGRYDLVMMIDVLEHIVEKAKCRRALDHLAAAVAPGGMLLLAFPPAAPGRFDLFYLRFWPLDEVLQHFPGWERLAEEPFRDGLLVGLRAPRGG